MIVIRPKNYRPPQGSNSAGEAPPNPEPATQQQPSQGQPGPDVSQQDSSQQDQPQPDKPKAIQPEPQQPDQQVPKPAATLQAALGERFEVLNRFAIGGMATLFLVRHCLHHGFFVAKVLEPTLAANPTIVASFRREARHVARLGSHPNLIPVFDLIEHDGLHILLMPYIEGEDLDHLLKRRGKLSRDEALTLLAQVTGLLIHAEEQGIVHGDLSPGNLRLDHFGQYRVLDFGLSRATDDEPGLALPQAGTPAYNSPEQIRNEPIDNRSDLYSLGVIFAEVLYGYPPFEADTLEELAQKHLRGEWKVAPEIEADPRIRALLDRLLAPQPGARFGDASQLAAAIVGLGFELTCTAPSPPGALLVPPRPRRRRLG